MSFVQVAFAIFCRSCSASGFWSAAITRWRAWLLAASLFFYGYRQWWVLSVILSYCLVDWLTGLWLQRTQHRRLALALGVGFNLAGALLLEVHAAAAADRGRAVRLDVGSA